MTDETGHTDRSGTTQSIGERPIAPRSRRTVARVYASDDTLCVESREDNLEGGPAVDIAESSRIDVVDGIGPGRG